MKFLLLLLISLISSKILFSQNKFQIDLSKIDNETKLIGRYPHFDKDKNYSKWNFIIDNPDVVKRIVEKLQYGSEIENKFERNSFYVELIQNHKSRILFSIHPIHNSIQIDGHSYSFDIESISLLNKKYPFNYSWIKKEFKSENEYKSFLSEQLKNPNYLFDYKPLFKFDGSFDVMFPKSKQFPNLNAIYDYLNQKIKKLEINKDAYRIGYSLTGINVTDKSQFTMTIESNEILFEKLELELAILKKGDWENTIETGIFFYREK